MSRLKPYIRSELLQKFEFQNYGHALEILSEAFPTEWTEIQDCLAQLTISVDELRAAGGNETAIPKKFDEILYPLGWREIRITGDLLVKLYPRRTNQRGRFSDTPFDEKELLYHIKDVIIIENDVDSPKVLSKVCRLYGDVLKTAERRENSRIIQVKSSPDIKLLNLLYLLSKSNCCRHYMKIALDIEKKHRKRLFPYSLENSWFSPSLKDAPEQPSYQDDV